MKTDGLGRVRTPVERREQLLDEFERSGLSGLKFAALVGIKYPTFASWLKRRRQQSSQSEVGAKPTETMRWLEAVVEQAQSPQAPHASSLMLELPAGTRVQITQVAQATLAATLIRALEKSC